MELSPSREIGQKAGPGRSWQDYSTQSQWRYRACKARPEHEWKRPGQAPGESVQPTFPPRRYRRWSSQIPRPATEGQDESFLHAPASLRETECPNRKRRSRIRSRHSSPPVSFRAALLFRTLLPAENAAFADQAHRSYDPRKQPTSGWGNIHQRHPPGRKADAIGHELAFA